jgi:ankyrin repeat protein
MADEHVRLRDLVARDLDLALILIRRGTDEGVASSAVEATRIIRDVDDATHAFWDGGFGYLLATQSGALHRYAEALQAVGAQEAAATCDVAAELSQTTGSACDIARLNDRFDSQDPPIRALLVDFIASQNDAWFKAYLSDQLSRAADTESCLWALMDLGHVAAMEYALSANRDPDWTEFEGSTILHKAVRRRPLPSRIEIAKLLLRAGVPVDIRDEDGRTPLHDAAQFGGAGFVPLLLENGADPNAACAALESTPLHWAGPDSAQLLLKAGAAPNARTLQGHTPLHYARTAAKVAVLLQGGADALACANGRESTLHHPLDADAIRLLVAAGANPDAQDDGGRTPLMCQAAAGPIEALLDLGARIDALDQLGRTALHHYAAAPDMAGCVEVLLQRGAGPMVRDTEGHLPVDLARDAASSNPSVALLETGRRLI